MQHWRISPITEQYFSGGAYLLFAVIAIALLAAWAASIFFTPLSPQRRVILAALRLAVISVLLFILLRPSHIVTENEKQSATLLLLFDQSRSMQIKDTPSGESRWDQKNSRSVSMRLIKMRRRFISMHSSQKHLFRMVVKAVTERACRTYCEERMENDCVECFFLEMVPSKPSE
jgi:hypothetical protein